MSLPSSLLRVSIVTVCCLLISTHGYAAKKKTEPFDAWLQTYHAWDVYEQELSTQSTSAENLLARARTLLVLDQPNKVVELLDHPFSAPEQEKQRLVLRARALRLLGNYEECIFTWLTLARSVSQEAYIPVIQKEPGLDLLFEDMWKQWFWEPFFTQNPGLHGSRSGLMGQILTLGKAAWPTHMFWNRVQPIYDQVSTLFSAPFQTTTLPVSEERIRIGKTLAYWSLGFWKQGDLILAGLANKDMVLFWQHVALLLGHDTTTRNDNQSSAYQTDAPASAQSFFTLFSPNIRSITTWLLTPPDATSWSSFVDRLKNENPASARAMIEQEQASMFLSPQLKRGLAVCRFALALQDEDILDLEQTWTRLATAEEQPPLLLGLAYMILGGSPRMPQNFQDAALLTYLGLAAGTDESSGVLAPFWDPLSSTNPYYLDYLKTYAALANQMTTAPDHPTAIHLAFLFPQSPAAQKGLLFLARETNKAGNKKLAWTYLQKIKTRDLDPNDRIEFLLARAGMEMELGYEDAALKDYGTLMQENPDRVPLKKQLKLALLGQQKRKWSWAQTILERLWDKRALVDEPIRAEILFWLGEGAQSQGKLQEALTYYLRLAWSYPRQNIWAVTAMYRSGLIYEKRGEFETAKRLYTSVLKHSDRDSQKKAAKTRIASVSAGMKQQKSSKNTPMF